MWWGEMPSDSDDDVIRVIAIELPTPTSSDTFSFGADLERALAVDLSAAVGPTQSSPASARLLQIEIVSDLPELNEYPFERWPNRAGGRLVGCSESPVEITRRSAVPEANLTDGWPSAPRVLFAWSEALGEVPASEHRCALEQALDMWWPGTQTWDRGLPPVADSRLDGCLVEVPNATLGAVACACRAAESLGRPFTHVHVLAGAPGPDTPEWVAAGRDLLRPPPAIPRLNGEDRDPGSLVEALRGSPRVVTLSGCADVAGDSVHRGTAALAFALQRSGVSVVLGSHAALRPASALLMVDAFYPSVLAGADVRIALHDLRVSLVDEQSTAGADWGNLCAYVRLPASYARAREGLRELAAHEALRRVRARAAHISRHVSEDLRAADEAIGRLGARIGRVEMGRPLVRATATSCASAEPCALIASSAKLRAELCFRRGLPDGIVRADLARARHYFAEDFRADFSLHAAGVEWLGLTAVLEGSIRELSPWTEVLDSAQRGLSSENSWEVYAATASMFELSLLSAYVRFDLAETTAVRPERELRSPEVWLTALRGASISTSSAGAATLERVRDQLERYSTWWLCDQGFFPGASDLSTVARPLWHSARALPTESLASTTTADVEPECEPLDLAL